MFSGIALLVVPSILAFTLACAGGSSSMEMGLWRRRGRRGFRGVWYSWGRPQHNGAQAGPGRIHPGSLL